MPDFDDPRQAGHRDVELVGESDAAEEYEDDDDDDDDAGG